MTSVDPQLQQLFDTFAERILQTLASTVGARSGASRTLSSQEMAGLARRDIKTVYRYAHEGKVIRVGDMTFRSNWRQKGDRAEWVRFVEHGR